MYKKVKDKLQLFFSLFLAAIVILALSIMIGVNLRPLPVTAQEPDTEPPFSGSIDEKDLAEFGLSIQDIQPLAGDYDLKVTKQANVTSVDSGDQVEFTISIQNVGSNEVQLTIFYDDYPPQMQNVSYDFGTTNVLSNGQAKPRWAIIDPIGVNETVVATVTGDLISGPDATVQNTAIVTGFNASGVDTQPSNNSSSVNVTINGSNPDTPTDNLVYLPIVHKNPQPEKILVYEETFNSGDPWVEFETSDCKAENTSNQYWVRLKDDNERCLPPADNDDEKPEQPYRTYGEFEVTAYQSEGPSDETDFGLFINGSGGDDYYYFTIRPNANNCSTGGNWRLVRRRDNDETTLRSGSCHSAIKRGTAREFANKLSIAHRSNRELSIFVNDTLLTTYTDSSSRHLTGEATGLFVFSEDDDVLVKFDNFRVYEFP